MKYEWGSGGKTPLILLHGLGSAALSFGELATYLSDYHVIAFDLPGHGQAEELQREEDYQPLNIVDKIEAEITKMGLDEFYIAGHSWGADLTLYYVKKYPQHVKGIILLNDGYLPNEGNLEQELKDVEAFHDSVRFPSWESFIESEKSEVDRWSAELEAASRSQVKMVDGELQLAVSKFTAKSVVKGRYVEPNDDAYTNITPTCSLAPGYRT
ncbi:alpha/beta fold hydrolase [Virgibacillus kekensis]|uniref:Alpha/beta fold hydrolase n=1 Tax=Virgibacillus kekensis TaxID=202261 RepID=A0ABV9DPM1_9BACI